MTFVIHYEINGMEDSYVISGDTVESIMEVNQAEMRKRGLHEGANNCWSEQV